MHFVYWFFLLLAGVLSITVVGLPALFIVQGPINFVFPGLGLVVTGWVIVSFLLMLDVLAIAACLLLRRNLTKPR
jgi:hypothetical protein